MQQGRRKIEAWRGHSPLCIFKREATGAQWPFHQRFRSRQSFGDAKDFFPNVPKLPEKFFVQLLPTNSLQQRSLRPFLVWPPKRSSWVFLQTLDAIFWSQATLGVIFARMFRNVAQGFSKSNFWGCACTTYTPTTNAFHNSIIGNFVVYQDPLEI